MPARTDDFMQGFGAFRNGKPRTECPFRRAHGEARRQWLAGWQEAARRAIAS